MARSRRPTGRDVSMPLSSCRTCSGVISGVRPSVMEYFSPRTVAAGFRIRMWRLTSRSNSASQSGECELLARNRAGMLVEVASDQSGSYLSQSGISRLPARHKIDESPARRPHGCVGFSPSREGIPPKRSGRPGSGIGDDLRKGRTFGSECPIGASGRNELCSCDHFH